MVNCRHVKKQELHKVTEANLIHWSRLEPVTSCMKECYLLGKNLFWSRLDWTGSEWTWVVTSCGCRIAWTLSYFKVTVALCVAAFITATVSCGTVNWNAHFPVQCFKLGVRIAQSI